MPRRLGLLAVAALVAGCGTSGAAGTRSGTNAPPAPSGWSAPLRLAGVHELQAVACPSPNFCTAVGGGQAVPYVRGKWGTPQSIDSHTGLDNGLDTVSCVSPTFCVAGDGTGNAFLYQGTHWSAARRVSKVGLGQISCSATTFCAAADANGTPWFFNGSSWSAHLVSVKGGRVNYISCPTSRFCMGLDSQSGTDTFRLERGRWIGAAELPVSLPEGGSEPNTGSGVSCPSSGFCVALDNFGEAFTWTGGRWSAPIKFDPDLLNAIDAVSCVAANACVVVDQNGLATRSDGHSWFPAQKIDAGTAELAAVSCATPQSCVAVDHRGDVLMYH